MPIKTPELVLLDLDGTLVDSIPDLAYSVNKTLSELSIAERDIENIRHWVGNGIDKLLHRALTNDIDGEAETKLFDEAFEKFIPIYNDNMCATSICYPGVREGIDFLKEKNIKLGCVTNKSGQFVGPILEKLGLMNDMSIVIAGDTLAKKKPDPLPLLHAATVFEKDPAQSLMIGDSESDVKAARAAGFQIVCVSYGYNHGNDIRETNPDAVVDSLAELPQLFH
ncbi:MAG TPA: phosphoglycolate phosphatase [Thiotrichaceae bacterium]|jgi:phosphoglycolate phosphatase|nr:phosphoglycolate phosphatase [Thiotrichaceae bacterium]HIM09033.1 phosphoglycolate phosphatase [Gammaproteobacteria bacterium]